MVGSTLRQGGSWLALSVLYVLLDEGHAEDFLSLRFGLGTPSFPSGILVEAHVEEGIVLFIWAGLDILQFRRNIWAFNGQRLVEVILDRRSFLDACREKAMHPEDMVCDHAVFLLFNIVRHDEKQIETGQK